MTIEPEAKSDHDENGAGNPGMTASGYERMPERYNDRVRQYFANPVHAGDLQREHPHKITATASESENGAQLSIEVGINAPVIAEMAFRARGCPHLIAAAEFVCAHMEGQPVAALAQFDAAEVSQILSIPLEKTGRIILLEDLLATLSRQPVSSN